MKIDPKEKRSGAIALFLRKGCMAGIVVILLSFGAVLFGAWWFFVKPDIGGLVAASMHGNVTEINRCLRGGVDINAKEKWGWSRDNDGRTPLTAAVQSSNTSTIALLIRAGANVNLPDGYGEPPVCDAARRGDIDIIRLLAAAGADFSVIRNGKSTPEIAMESKYPDAAEEIRKILATKRQLR